MKNITKHVLFLIILFSITSCSNKKENEEIMNFYLSQPRDTELVGWWVRVEGRDSIFRNNQASGIFLSGLIYVNGKFDLRGEGYNNYWYSKDNRFYTFYRSDSRTYGSVEKDRLYKIKNDSLWISDSTNDNNIHFIGKRTYPRL